MFLKGSQSLKQLFNPDHDQPDQSEEWRNAETDVSPLESRL